MPTPEQKTKKQLLKELAVLRSRLAQSGAFEAERNRMKEALRESEDFSSSLLTNSPNPIMVINSDTSIRYVNPALEKLTGFISSELLGTRAPYPWWDKSKREVHSKHLMATLQSGIKIEMYNRKRNGERFWVELTSQPVIVDGHFKYLLSSWVDITKRKIAEEQLKKLNRELRDLYLHLQSVRENERANIAREVHDELGQALTALKMDVCWLDNEVGSERRQLSDIIDSMNRLIDETLQKVKWISVGLRPSLLDDIGLADAVEWLAREFQLVTGVQCTVSISSQVNDLDRDRSTAIFRVLQEAFTNVFRHAKATNMSVELKKCAHAIILKVVDNGIGITKQQISDPKAFGLLGMREYVHYWGGKIRIKGVANKGTTITVNLPIPGVYEGKNA